MTRPYGVKGGRKRKHAEPKYDEEDQETQPKKAVVEVEHNKEEEQYRSEDKFQFSTLDH